MDNFAGSQPYSGSLSRPVLISKEECVWPGEESNAAEEALMRNHGLSLAEARELAAEGNF